MKFTTEISISEFKALIELIAELCRINGIDEAVSRSLLKRMNESFR